MLTLAAVLWMAADAGAAVDGGPRMARGDELWSDVICPEGARLKHGSLEWSEVVVKCVHPDGTIHGVKRVWISSGTVFPNWGQHAATGKVHSAGFLLRSETHYQDGEKDGLELDWRLPDEKTGNPYHLHGRLTWSRGKAVKDEYFRPDGKPEMVTEYRDGRWFRDTIFRENGTVDVRGGQSVSKKSKGPAPKR